LIAQFGRALPAMPAMLAMPAMQFNLKESQ
jgi:hypothetical protein